MKKLYILFIVISLVSGVSCEKSGKYTSTKLCVNRGVISEYELDSIEVQLDSLSMDMYGMIKRYEDDQVAYLVAYNNKTHSFDWFDLKKKEVSHTKLDRQGPHSVLQVQNFQILDGSRVVVGLRNKFSIVKRNGEIEKSFSTPNGNGREFYSGFMSAFVFDTVKSDVVSRSFIPKQKGGLFAKLDLKTNHVKEFSIEHLESHRSSIVKFGGWNYSYIFNHLDNYIYNYNYSSDIFLYNDIKDEHMKIEYKSKLSKNLRTPPVEQFPSKKAWVHHCRNPFFRSIQFDDSRKLFYRVHDKMVDKNISDEELESRNSDKVLTFFDENFENGYEFLLSSERYFSGDVFDFKRGYAIFCNNALDPNYNPDVLKIHFYKFKLN